MNTDEFREYVGSIYDDRDLFYNRMEGKYEVNGVDVPEAINSAIGKLITLFFYKGNRAILTPETYTYFNDDVIVYQDRVGERTREIGRLEGKAAYIVNRRINENFSFDRLGLKYLLRLDEVMSDHIEVISSRDCREIRFVPRETQSETQDARDSN